MHITNIFFRFVTGLVIRDNCSNRHVLRPIKLRASLGLAVHQILDSGNIYIYLIVTACIFQLPSASEVGYLFGPQTFKRPEAPRYRSAKITMVAMASLTLAIGIGRV